MKTETESTNLRSVMPGFAVRDMEKAIAFYEGTLGFRVTFRNGEVFAIVRRDQVELSLSLDRSELRAGRGACYVKLQGVDAIYHEVRAGGATIIHELKDEAYGMREFMIADVDGNTLNFGEPMGQ